MSVMFEFVLTSLVLIAIPGPDQALITRNAVVHGRRAGVRTMLGGATGLAVHGVGAAVGISAVLAASATAFTVVKVAGMAYLLYLGVKLLRSRGTAAEEATGDASRPYLQGLASNVLNPKVALFFLTFLPQFVPADAPALPVALGLSATFALLYLAWFGGLLTLVELVAGALRRPRVQAWLERFSGAALVGFAGRLAAGA